ncbi:MAG: adenosylcobinamide amidohydrolase [Deltaproteobacteria bacterium]|nr:adenosylcobinamide amidohydrolase [Deltaproteobacteria bacterium]
MLLAGSLLAGGSAGEAINELEFSAPPKRIVSLSPTASEMIAALGVHESLVGLTYLDVHLPELAGKALVGGPDAPHWPAVRSLNPDLVIVAPTLYEQAKEEFNDAAILIWDVDMNLAQSKEKFLWLAGIFDKTPQAEKLISDSQNLLELIALKTQKIPADEKLRVLRVALKDGKLISPADDSFQTEIVKASGGIAAVLGEGQEIVLTPENWLAFNPQFVYACADGSALKQFLSLPPWNEAEAVKNQNIRFFPCALTDRAATNVGYFVAWLSSSIYYESFSKVENLIEPNAYLGQEPIALDVPYVEKARIIDSRLMDFTHRTLVIDFKSPQKIVSTVTGQTDGIKAIGNSYSPTPVWDIYHMLGFEKSQQDLYQTLELDPKTTSLLATGADMTNLVVKSVEHQDLSVTALVTAGVEGNALRSAHDEGAYFEKPGTINIIVMTNRRLTDRAATRALITITEAKSAALWDMDIRSVQTPLDNPATGTGTDDVIVVQGEGPSLDYSGGHSKLGQLISEVVCQAVKEAILKQNGKLPHRNVFERLQERGLSIETILGSQYAQHRSDFVALLLNQRYQSFLEAAFSLSDAQSLEQLSDHEILTPWALGIAGEIAQKQVTRLEDAFVLDGHPQALAIALNALITGLVNR